VSALRVAHVVDSLGRGGTQTFLVHLTRGLAGRGFVQLVVALGDEVDGAVRAGIEASGVEVRVIGKAALASGWGLARLALALRGFSPQVVQTLLPHADILGRVAARACTPARVVSSIRARNVDKRRWQFLLDRLTAGLADRVVFNSAAVVPFALAREGVRPGQVVVIPNGVAVADADPTAAAALRRSLLPGGGGPLLVAVGRLWPQKDYPTLLEALALVRRRRPGTVLLVAGTGPLLAALRARAGELGLGAAVRFLGRRDDVGALLAAADVFVHAARFEGQPNAVMEAMAAGAPVVATAVDGAAELVEPGRDGLLVPAGDPAALAGAVAGLLDDPSRARALGRAAREKMRARYSLEAMTGAYAELYRAVAGR